MGLTSWLKGSLAGHRIGHALAGLEDKRREPNTVVPCGDSLLETAWEPSPTTSAAAVVSGSNATIWFSGEIGLAVGDTVGVRGFATAVVNQFSTTISAFTNTTSIPYDTQTVNFTVGQTITGPSGSGRLVYQVDSGATGTLYLDAVTGSFADNDSLSDPLGGAALVNGSTSLSGYAYTFPVSGRYTARTPGANVGYVLAPERAFCTSVFQWAQILSGNRMRILGNAAAAGASAAEILSDLDYAISLNPARILFCGFTNNNYGDSVNLAGLQDYARQAIAKCNAAGIIMDYVLPPPRATYEGSWTTARRNKHWQFCRWLKRYAPKYGVRVIDSFAATAAGETALSQVPAGSTLPDQLTFGSQTVNFPGTIGYKVTGAPSGATGYVMAQTDAGATGTLHLGGVSGVFAVGDTLSATDLDGAGTTGNGTLTAVAQTHAIAGNPTWGWLAADGIHWSIMYAYAVGKALGAIYTAEVSASYCFPFLPHGSVDDITIGAAASNYNFHPNPRFTGTGGTKTAGSGTIIGNAPDDTKINNVSGTQTCTLSQVARTVAADGDAIGYNWRVVITGAKSNTVVDITLSNTAAFASFTNGDVLQSACQIKVTSGSSPGSGNPTGLSGLQFTGSPYTNTSGYKVCRIGNSESNNGYLKEAFNGVLVTPQVTVRTPSGTHGAVGAWGNVITVYFAAAGDATIDIGAPVNYKNLPDT